MGKGIALDCNEPQFRQMVTEIVSPVCIRETSTEKNKHNKTWANPLILVACIPSKESMTHSF